MRKTRAVFAGIAVALAVSASAHAVGEPDANDGIYPPQDERSLDVTAFESVCISDAPWVQYKIVPKGFTPEANSATLTITDINGKLIKTLKNQPLEGRFLFPGAKLGNDGKPIDWPGWVKENGKWRAQTVDEPGSDAIWRKGLNIRVDVNPTAFVDPPVVYPDGSPFCLGPDEGNSPSANPPEGQTGTLPTTGSNGIDGFVQIGVALVVGGALLTIGAHRRRTSVA